MRTHFSALVIITLLVGCSPSSEGANVANQPELRNDAQEAPEVVSAEVDNSITLEFLQQQYEIFQEVLQKEKRDSEVYERTVRTGNNSAMSRAAKLHDQSLRQYVSKLKRLVPTPQERWLSLSRAD